MTLRDALHNFALEYCRNPYPEARKRCLNEIIGKINAMLPRKTGWRWIQDDAAEDTRKELGI